MTERTSVFLNQLIEIHGPARTTVHRVLHIDGKARQVALFDTEAKKALPTWVDFEDLQRDLDEERARPLATDTLLPPFLPDDALTDAAKKVRDARLAVIASIASSDADPEMRILRSEHRGGLIAEAVARHGTAKDKIYAWLRRWWRHGQMDNALLPDFQNCGRGSYAKPGAKRGRKLSPESKSHDGHIGVGVDPRIKRLILKGARMFWNAKRGGTARTKQDAYQLTLQHLFHKRLEMKDGVLTAIVREGPEDDNRLPTFAQWDYHVEESLRKDGALEARYNDRELALRRRPVLGTSEGLSRGPGDLYLIDATVADMYLLSSFDKRWVIGRPVLYLVVDHYSRMVVGMHIALEGPNWTGAMMALANAFSDKVAFCASHGIEISHEDWPCDVAPNRLTADRGEVISEHADYIVPGFRMAIHDTPPFRADFKSFVEGQFKITNETGLKRMPGWVDKLKDRGGRDYRLDAVLDFKGFTQMMITLVLHNNSSRPIASNIPNDFPLADGEDPVPLELWDWGLSNASPSVRRFVPEDVRRNLLPTFEAVHTRHGLSVLGGKLHYTTPRAIAEGWFVNAPNRGGKVERLAIHPWDASIAYLRRPKGELEKCELTPADVKRYAGRTLADVEDSGDRDARRKKGNTRLRIQREADLNGKLNAIKDRAAKERREALDAADRAKPDLSAMSAMRNVERDVQRLENASSVDKAPEREADAVDGSAAATLRPAPAPAPDAPSPPSPTSDDGDEEHVFMPD